MGFIQAGSTMMGAWDALANGNTAIPLHYIPTLATQAVVTGQTGSAFGGTSCAVSFVDDVETLSALKAGGFIRAPLAII